MGGIDRAAPHPVRPGRSLHHLRQPRQRRLAQSGLDPIQPLTPLGRNTSSRTSIEALSSVRDKLLRPSEKAASAKGTALAQASHLFASFNSYSKTLSPPERRRDLSSVDPGRYEPEP